MAADALRGQIQRDINYLDFITQNFNAIDGAAHRSNVFTLSDGRRTLITADDLNAYANQLKKGGGGDYARQVANRFAKGSQQFTMLDVASGLGGIDGDVSRGDISALKNTRQQQLNQLDNLLARLQDLRSRTEDSRQDPQPSRAMQKFERLPGSWIIDASQGMEGFANVLNPVTHVVHAYKSEVQAVTLLFCRRESSMMP